MVEPINQFCQHGSDTFEHLLSGLDAFETTHTFGDQGIQASRAFRCRAARVVEELRSCLLTTPAIAFRDIEEHR